MLTPIHNHSYFSSLDGFSSPKEIAERCQEIGAEACGLTDHGVVSGHLEFAKVFQEHKLKPLFGMEAYHGLKTTFKGQERDQAHLILIAQTDEGLRNLWRLTSRTANPDRFRWVGRVFWEDLERHNEGLIATSACPLGLVTQGLLQGDYDPLNRYLEIFGDRFYIELHTYPCDHPFTDDDYDGELSMRVINQKLVEVANERGIPVVFACDAHYAHPDQAVYHDVYLAMQTRQSIYTDIEERKMWHPPGALTILDEEQVRDALAYLPDTIVDEAIANSLTIADSCQANLPEVKRHLPMFVPGDCPWLTKEQRDQSAEALFVDLVEAGIKERYVDPTEEVWERALYEMETLLHDGIHHYFLMGWDTIRAAEDKGIAVGPGRGSAAGSIVAYALGITDVDPLYHGLIFERFWNSGRTKGFPDIDTDFARERRGEIISYLKERWGHDKVCAIGTVGYFKPKGLIDQLAKWCEITYAEADELKEIVGRTPKIDIQGHLQIGWNPEYEPGKVIYVNDAVGTDIQQWCRADPERRPLREMFVSICEMLNSRVQKYGIHASGIVISDVPLADELPSYLRGSDSEDAKVPVTQFAMADVEARRFVKLDVLGLRTLDVLSYWEGFMREQGVEIEWSGLDKRQLPEDLWALLRDGFTAGIFQVEDGYGRQLCKQMEPRSVEDLSIINALNRPGPIQAGIPDRYIERRQNNRIEYLHPRLQELVHDSWDATYGLIIYQEQIIALFNRLGYSLSESDAVRSMLGKKRSDQLEAIRDGTGEWKDRGYFEMTEVKNIPHDVAEILWRELEGFADYSFNKSHTVAYAVVGLRTLVAKYYGPAWFYAASTRSFGSTDRKKRLAMLPEYINECFRQGIAVRPPDIRYARAQSYAQPDTWYFGFCDIKNVGSSGEYVVFLRDEMGLEIDTPAKFTSALEVLNDRFLAEKKIKVKEGEWDKKMRSPKQMLGSGKILALVQVGAWDDMGVRDISLTERQQNEMNLLGVVLTENSKEVLDRHAELIAGCDPYIEVLTSWDDKIGEEERDYFQYDVAGVLMKVQEKRTRKEGHAFGLATIELDGNHLQFLVPHKKWSSFKRVFRQAKCVGIFTVRQFPPNEYGDVYMYHAGRSLR